LTPFLFPRLDSKLKMMIRIALLFRHLRWCPFGMTSARL
jgi:hypothetical protein